MDAFLVDILKDMKGKVVLIDIWNTWCGPCIGNMNEMKKYESKLKDKGVEVIYIANESSPEARYKKMIPNYKGHHYRISENLCGKLMDKYNCSDFPSYLYVNKKGEMSKQKSSDVEDIVDKLEKLAAE